MAGLDRYQTVTWRLMHDAARGFGLRVQGRVKPYAPPFMMLGVNLENTTSSDFRMTATARYLAFDVVGSGSELRIDGTIGSDPSVAIELYRPIGSTPLFVAPYAGVGTRDVQSHRRRRGDCALQTDRRADRPQRPASISARRAICASARTSDARPASIEVGDPGFPELRGKETGAELVWRVDTQDSPVIPSGGWLSQVRLSHVFDGPDIVVGDQTFDFDVVADAAVRRGESLLEHRSAQSRVRLWRTRHVVRVDAVADQPVRTWHAVQARRLRAPASCRGAHYYVATGGYLRRVGRLPDFMGGPVFAGGWLENGDAFDEWQDAGWRTNGGVGLVMDTLVGPVILAGSWSFDGRWRTYLGCRPHVPLMFPGSRQFTVHGSQ